MERNCLQIIHIIANDLKEVMGNNKISPIICMKGIHVGGMRFLKRQNHHTTIKIVEICYDLFISNLGALNFFFKIIGEGRSSPLLRLKLWVFFVNQVYL
jgi:hypothetical protein